MCSHFQLVLRGGNIKGLIVMEALVFLLGSGLGRFSLQVCQLSLPYSIKRENTSFLSSLLQLVLSRQGARERLSAWQNTQVQL